MTTGNFGASALSHAYPPLPKRAIQSLVDEIAQRAAVLKREGLDVDMLQANVQELNFSLVQPDQPPMGFAEWLASGE